MLGDPSETKEENEESQIAENLRHYAVFPPSSRVNGATRRLPRGRGQIGKTYILNR